MAAQIVSIFQRQPRQAPASNDWTQQELAEFYRVESALIRAGLSIETDRGMSDEDEPWFVFLRAEDGEVVIHFARIDGEYLIAGPAYERVARGFDFNGLVRNMIARHPLIQPRRRDGNVFMHPAALLIAIVGTAFFKTGEAKAMDEGKAPAARKPIATITSQSGASAAVQGQTQAHSVYVEANQALTILAGAMFALEQGVDSRSRSVNSSLMASQMATDAARAASSFSEAALAASAIESEAAHNALFLSQASAVLSLVAVLETLDQRPISTVSTAQAAPSPIVHTDIGQPRLSDGVISQAPIYMEIQLRPGGMPGVESVQLIREMAGRGFEKIAVVALDKLPAAIAEIIAAGADFGAGIVTPEPSFTPPFEGPTLPTTPVDGGSDGLTPGGEATVVITPVVPQPPAPTPTSEAYKAIAQKLIAYFVAHVPWVEVLTAGSEVVFYDMRVLTHAQVLEHVDSVTFHFNDGSSISLVGEHSSLYPELG